MMMKRYVTRILWPALTLALALLLALPFTTYANADIDSVTLSYNGVTIPDNADYLIVDAGSTISVSIQVTGSGDTYWNDWKSTNWMIRAYNSTGIWTCVDTPDYTDGATHTEVFDITAPSTPGTYNVYFQTYTVNNCDATIPFSTYDEISIPDSIVVVVQNDIIESYGAGCTMQQDDFGEGQGVCMQATDLASGHWQIRWLDPSLTSVRSVEGDVTSGEYSDSWTPLPCNEGTWVTELRKGSWNPTTHQWVYDTVDVDTFYLSCGPSLASYKTDCATANDDFSEGDNVCMVGTGLGINPFNVWQIEWLAPGATSSTHLFQIASSLNNSISTSWTPLSCVQGTWTVNLNHRLLFDPIDSWATKDTDTFDLICNECTPPSITTQPVDQTITVGEDAFFTVAGTGYSGVQWQVNSGSGWTNIVDSTTANLTISAPTVSMSGNQYRAVLTGSCEPVATSAAATLTVNPTDPFLAFTSLTTSLTPSVYGDTVIFKAVVSTSGGEPVGKVHFYELIIGAYGEITQVLLGEDTTATFLQTGSYEYSFSTSALAIGQHVIFAAYDDGSEVSPGMSELLYQTVEEKIWPTVTISTTPPQTSYSTEATFEFSSNIEDAEFECSLVEGQVSDLDALTWTACNSPKTYTDLSYFTQYTFIVRTPGAPPILPYTNAYQWFISVPQVTILSGPAQLTDNTEATITFSSNPEGVDLECYLAKNLTGTESTVIVEDWAPCSGSRTYTDLSHGYDYYFAVKPKGIADNYAIPHQWTIAMVMLTSSQNPSEEGSEVTLTATVWSDDGTMPDGTVSFAEMVYSWPGMTLNPIGQDSSPTASGTDTYLYTFATSTLAVGSHDIMALYTDDEGTTTSVLLTQQVIEVIAQAPVMTVQPTNNTVCAGATVNFTASANGTPTPTVQWQVSNDGGNTWNNISGATTSTYSFTATASDNGKKYHALFTNSAGSIASATATLTVNTAPSITDQPDNQTVTYGALNATFSVAATGTAPTVLWQQSTNTTDWANISGATAWNLTLANPTVAMNGTQYQAVINNLCGTATSDVVTLTVNKADPTCAITGYAGAYDGAPHGASGSCTGVNGEALTGLNRGNTFTNVPGGTANWTFTDTSGNYNDASGNASIVITKATSTVTVTCPESVGFNGAAQTPCTAMATGVGMTPVSVTASLVYANNIDAGTATVDASWVGDANHSGSTDSTSFEITAARVTLTAGSYSGTYNGATHVIAACQVSGDYTGDVGCTNDPASVGPYVGAGAVTSVIILNGETASNFEITSQNGSWSIKPAPVTIEAGSYSGVYDGASHISSDCAVTGAYTGALSCTNDPTSVGLDVGAGNITPVLALNGEAATNFTLVSANGSWKITPAPVTATAGSYSSTYDGAAHATTDCQVTGNYTGDLSCTNDPASVGPDVGASAVTPVIVLNGETETNFEITSQNGSWSITPSPVTIEAGSYNGVYDGMSHQPSDCAVTGAYTGALSCTNDPTSVGPDVGAGDVAPVLALNGEAATNFTVVSDKGSWEITAAPVTATAGSYGSTYDGVVHAIAGCQVTGTYTGDLTCTNDPASVGPDVGSGIVKVGDVKGTGLSNFAITSTDGSWEITPTPVTATAGSYNGTYDDATHAITDCQVTGVYTGDLTCTNTPASIGPDAGSGIVTVDEVFGSGLSNFAITKTDGFWRIDKATLTVTADDVTAQHSDASPVSFTYTGFQGDDTADDIDVAPTCSTTRLISSPAGTYPIVCAGGDDNNYTFSYSDGTFTVEREDAKIALDNEVAFNVDAPGEDVDTLVLYATVQETSPDTGYETLPGDIDKAQVSMNLTPVGPGEGATGTCVKLQDNGQTDYSQVNTYACTFSNIAVNTYLVEAKVNGDYYISGIAEDVLVVVDPSLGFTSAGGWFYWPGTTDKTNFGFTMKYNKKGNQVQGNLLLIRHTEDGSYRIKSNALYGLALGEIEESGTNVGWASFSGKCTYQEPDWIEPEGNHTFIVYVEDWSELGTGHDKFWIDVSDDDDNLSLGSDTQADWVYINGGNILVPHTPN